MIHQQRLIGDEKDPDFMLSLARGMAILKVFGRQSSLSVAEAAEATGLNRTSSRRCLHTMEVLGYLTEISGRYYPTAGMLPLATSFIGTNPVVRAAQSIVASLRDQLNETVSLGMLDTSSTERTVYVARAEKNQVISAPLMIGSTLPSHCTSMGRILLANLETDSLHAWLAGNKLDRFTDKTITDAETLKSILVDIKSQQWAIVEEELELGLRSLAVPVRGPSGLVAAALNVATFSHAHTREHLLDAYLPALRAAASQLESFS